SKPYHILLAGDNHGTNSVGKNQLSASLSTDRLLDLNELLFYTHRQSQPNDEARRANVIDSLGAVVPYRYTTASVLLSRSHYVTTVTTASGVPLQFRGTNQTDNARLEQVLYRGRSTRIALAGALTLKDNKNYLADQLLVVSSRPLTVLDIDGKL